MCEKKYVCEGMIEGLSRRETHFMMLRLGGGGRRHDARAANGGLRATPNWTAMSTVIGP